MRDLKLQLVIAVIALAAAPACQAAAAQRPIAELNQGCAGALLRFAEAAGASGTMTLLFSAAGAAGRPGG
jgi:hypothetical protein